MGSVNHDSNDVLVGIVTFNPEVKKLEEYIYPLINKFDIIVVDNCSKNYEVLYSVMKDKVQMIPQQCNYGIAHALNVIMNYAKKNEYEWVLTLDQDTEIPEESILEMLNYTDEQAGVLCPICNERNGHRRVKTKGDREFVEECITAGQLTSVDAWEAIGGYDEKLFIDFVDFDFCWRLNNAGIKIMRINTANMVQEVGELKEIKLLNHYIYVREHSPDRYYYVMRNRIYCMRRILSPQKKKKETYQLIVQTLKTLIFETDRLEKAKMMIKGARDSCDM